MYSFSFSTIFQSEIYLSLPISRDTEKSGDILTPVVGHHHLVINKPANHAFKI